MKLGTALIAAAITLLSSGGAMAAGELNIYNWGNYTSPEMVTKFERKYDIKVTITDFDSNDTAMAKIRQGGHGFDMIVPSQNYAPIMIKEGLLLESRPDQMANFKNLDKAAADADFDPGRHYTIPWAVFVTGIGVNTDVYKGDINTWGIIFDTPQELRGKVNVVPEMNDVIDAAIFYNGGKKCSGDLDLLKKVRDNLVAAKKNWIAMDYGTIQKMIDGDYSAVLTWNGNILRMRQKRASIKFGFPKEGFVSSSDNLAILKAAKNVENAKLFMNFMMDPENSAMNSAFHGFATGVTGTDAYLPESMRNAPELTVPEQYRKVEVAAGACPPQIQALYTKIWTEVLK